MKKTKLLLLVFFFAKSYALEPFKAVYKLSFNGWQVAEEKRQLTKAKDDTYFYTANANTTGLISILKSYKINAASKFRFKNDKLDSIFYKRKEFDSDDVAKDVSIAINSDEQIVKTTKKNKTWNTKKGNVIDDLNLMLAIANDLKKKPNKKDFYYQVADGKKIANQHFITHTRDAIKINDNNTEIIKLKKIVKDKDRKIEIWLAPKFNYIAVKIIQNEPNGDIYEYNLIALNDAIITILNQ